MVDKRKSPDYQELRGFIPVSLSMQFKAVCKGLGKNINDSLEEAVMEWVSKQKQTGQKRQSNNITASPSNYILPTIANAIEETLKNEKFMLLYLSIRSDIKVNRLEELLLGARATDEEIKKLAGNLVKFSGDNIDEEELVDMRLAEDIKQRQQRRELDRQKLQPKKKKQKNN